MTARSEDIRKNKPQRFISLRLKWAATMSFGIFLTFLVFSLVIYGVMRQTLVEQARGNVSDTMSAVENRLTPVADNLTVESANAQLDTTITEESRNPNSVKSNASIYTDTTVEMMSREDMTVTVYDNQGTSVFSPRGKAVKLHRTNETTIKSERTSKFDGLVGRVAIYSDVNGKLIGYVQVMDAMTDFHATMNRITGTLYSVSIAALIVSAVLGFLLAAQFLKPIRRITKTIDAISSEPQSDVRIKQSSGSDELSHLTTGFNDMLDRLQRYIDAQSDFVGDVSHELRTPVAILEGHLQLLNRWGKDDPEVLEESLGASLQELARMKSLIQEMLDLTRADQVETQFSDAVANVKQISNQVANDMQMIHPDFHITIEDELDAATWVRVYRNHLEQILIILVDNAVKYSKNRNEVHVSVAANDHEVNLAVQDFGEGISPDNIDRVFGRFYRVDKARSREKGGNGLGLAIAKQLIDGYHGTISVESVVGFGSIFRVSLPRITEEQANELMEQHEAADDSAAVASDIAHSNL